MAKINWDNRADSGANSAVSASIFNDTKTSVNTLYDVVNARLGTTSSDATARVNFTGPTTISGSMQVSGSIIPNVKDGATTSSFDLGSPTQAWRDIYVSDGSIKFVKDASVSSFTKQELDDIRNLR